MAGLALAACLCLFGPAILAVWWRRKSGAPWKPFFSGALVFFVSQVVLRFPWQIPLAHSIYRHPKWLVPFLLVSSLTAGLFEETGRWLGYRFLIREHTRRVGTMFGLGHGGLESMLLAGFPLASLLVMWVLAQLGWLHSGPVLQALHQRTAGLDFWNGLLPALERAGAMAFHVGCALIVLRGWTRRQPIWLAIAIGIHFAINALTATLIYLYRVRSLRAELVFVVLALGVLALGWRVTSGLVSPVPAVPETPKEGIAPGRLI
jgi:uncharacterized membrane protein YhfC